MHGNGYRTIGNNTPKDGSSWEENKGINRVIRGGSWNDRSVERRSAFRNVNEEFSKRMSKVNYMVFTNGI